MSQTQLYTSQSWKMRNSRQATQKILRPCVATHQPHARRFPLSPTPNPLDVLQIENTTFLGTHLTHVSATNVDNYNPFTCGVMPLQQLPLDSV
jgi:hypothetical protein